ncbi:Gfo/Idh/MocA family oxidoreductase [Sporomusa sp.]|uniref:Gfo/Idh/MocA family protein n=1 Tax=Sporomusa sp. TaxID=2078658 RepID=UPI002BD9CCB6|nr:Gfo/Idh/MocA family oxidoreductase [Sporomusa sp.]HWR43784.1 Gfo/Idh/MocA family oxidoreductase [Sporomusa sp.]
MKGKIKAAIIGSGFIGPVHVEAVRRLGYVDVAAIAEYSQEVAEQKAAELCIDQAYGDYRQVLADPEIAVIHNCTPNFLHHQINKEAIAAGKHVLSEKPLAMDTSESGEILKLANEQGIVHGVNFNYRQYPAVQQLRAMLAQNQLGSVYTVHGSYLQDWLLKDTDYNWRLEPKISGKSRALADIGSHWCDTVQHVIGQSITEVYADIATILPVRKRAKAGVSTFSSQELAEGQYDEVPIVTEDYATVLVRFSGGARGVFTVSQVSAGRKNRFSFEIDGSKSAAFWNQEEPEKLWFGHRDRPNEMLLADPSLYLTEAKSYIRHPGGHNEGWPDGVRNMMHNFYSFIRDGKNPAADKADFATFADGHRIMCIIEAILTSHTSSHWVKVAY